MNALEFLMRARGLDKRREVLKERIEYLRSKTTQVTPSYESKVKGGIRKDRYDHLASLVDAEAELELLDKYEQDVIDVISALADLRQLDVMWLYYIDNYSWKDICEELKCGKTYACSVRARALKEIKIPAMYQEKLSTKCCGHVETVDMCKTALNKAVG